MSMNKTTPELLPLKAMTLQPLVFDQVYNTRGKVLPVEEASGCLPRTSHATTAMPRQPCHECARAHLTSHVRGSPTGSIAQPGCR